MIVFVGSNPSHAGSESPAIKNLRQWVERMRIEEYHFTNVSSKVTPNNRPLKVSEYELDRLQREIYKGSKFVALGRTASDALDRLNIAHFKLPHPSPRNRTLNAKDVLTMNLMKCKEYVRC